MQIKVDELGRYIFLFCRIENRTCILANVYIPPPFNTSILCRLIQFVLDKPGVPVIVIGDFIMVIDHTLTDTRLAGLRDIWRIQNLEARRNSCFSRTNSTLFRIDLVL